jgi:hypothetical protein
MTDALAKPAPPASAVTDADLAKQINDHLKEMEETTNRIKQTVLQQALRLGELLLQAKAKVGHGKFKAWLDRNCHLSERSAQRYMALKEQWPKIEAWLKLKSATVAELSLRKAEQIIAPQPDPPSPEQQQPGGNGIGVSDVPDADPVVAALPATIKEHEEVLVISLKTLRKSDAPRAKGFASALVKRLVDADLYDAWSGAR